MPLVDERLGKSQDKVSKLCENTDCRFWHIPSSYPLSKDEKCHFHRKDNMNVFKLDKHRNKVKATLFVAVVVLLSSVSLPSYAVEQVKPNNKNTMSADRILKEEESRYKFGASVNASRSTSLYDHQDGTRSDSMDYRFIAFLAMPYGKITTIVDYTEDLRDPENTAAGLYDPIIQYGFKSTDWAWSAPYVLTFAPNVSLVVPATKRSIKRDQLNTAISTGISFGIKPDGIYKSDGTWSVIFGLSAGQNFHMYEEDINGKVLNKYSSNQSLNIGYSISDWDFSLSYVHRSRWTYQNNIRESYALSQYIGYSLTENFGLSMGHSNEGPAIKANGYESNLNVIDENNSVVYFGVNASI